ncbi:MAG: hypothetical protein ACRD0Z_03255 [Acidimicrobiales bacterium]
MIVLRHLPVVILLTVLAIVLGLVSAVSAVSATPFLRPQTRVAAIATPNSQVVGLNDTVLPGGSRPRAPTCDLNATGSSVAAEEEPGSVVIGENMEERVQPAADRIGADTYQPDSTAPRSEWEQNQRDWINKQMDDGKTIYDCGPDPGRASFPGISSPWYQIERGEIAARSYPTIPLDC